MAKFDPNRQLYTAWPPLLDWDLFKFAEKKLFRINLKTKIYILRLNFYSFHSSHHFNNFHNSWIIKLFLFLFSLKYFSVNLKLNLIFNDIKSVRYVIGLILKHSRAVTVSFSLLRIKHRNYTPFQRQDILLLFQASIST